MHIYLHQIVNTFEQRLSAYKPEAIQITTVALFLKTLCRLSISNIIWPLRERKSIISLNLSLKLSRMRKGERKKINKERRRVTTDFTLIFKWFWKLDVLRTFIINRQRGDDQISFSLNHLPYYTIPTFYVAAIYLFKKCIVVITYT